MTLMSMIQPLWLQIFAAAGVQLTEPREGMLQLNTVPAGADYNCSHTNLLLRCLTGGGEWRVFVDEGFQYVGQDQSRRQLFGGPCHKAWLALQPSDPLRGDLNDALLQALRWLDSPLCEQLEKSAVVDSSEADSELHPDVARVGRLLGEKQLMEAGLEPTTAQGEAVLRAGETVLRQKGPTCPLIGGPSGCGKTTVARLAALRLLKLGRVDEVIELSGAMLAAGATFVPERDERLRRALQGLELQHSGAVVVLENFELATARTSEAPALLTEFLDRGLRLIGVTRSTASRPTSMQLEAVARRLEWIPLRPPKHRDVLRIVSRRIEQHPLAGRVRIPAEVAPAVAAGSLHRAGANPSAALGLLDAVVTHAEFAGLECIGPDDVYHLVSLQPPWLSRVQKGEMKYE